MTTARNDITGAKLQTRPATAKYYAGWDAIFGKKKEEAVEAETEAKVEETAEEVKAEQ